MDDERRAAHEETPRPIVTGDDPRRLRIVIVVLIAVIAVLLVRPWGDAGTPTVVGPAPTSIGGLTGPLVSPGSASEVAASTATPAATGSAEARQVRCGSPDGWRATTVQQWPDRILPVRSWIAIDPMEATGPADPTIPLAPVAASVVTAIGYCAPLAARLQPPAGATATLWTLTPDGPLRLSPVGLDAVTLYRQGALWGPAPELAAVPRDGGAIAWPPGSYVIEIADPGRSFDRWLGLEILDLAQRRGSGTGPSPTDRSLRSPGSSLDPGDGPSPGSASSGSSARG